MKLRNIILKNVENLYYPPPPPSHKKTPKKTPNCSSETDDEEEASGRSNPSTDQESNNDYMSDYSYNSDVWYTAWKNIVLLKVTIKSFELATNFV